MKVYCRGCGGDCSNAYGTWHGYPYHIMCIPGPTKKRRDPNSLLEKVEANAARPVPDRE